MGRYDNHTWTTVEDFSVIRNIEFSNEFLIRLFTLLLKMEKTEEDI